LAFEVEEFGWHVLGESDSVGCLEEFVAVGVHGGEVDE